MAGTKALGWFGERILPALLCVGFASAASSVEVVGSNQATLEWQAAAGAVSGYYVIVSRDSQPAAVEGVSLSNSETVEGAFGETVVIQVAAFGDDGVAGPVSEASDPITFVEAPNPDDPGSGDPGDGSGGDSGGGSDGGDGDPSDGTDPGPGSGRALVRDFSGDGLSDLIIRDGDSLRVWVMSGAQVDAEIALPDAPAGADLVGTGDYDGNQSADLLWENPEDGKLTLWRLNGGVIVDAHVVHHGLPDTEQWHVGGSADFDGNGADDVMMFSRVAGMAEIWSFDGTGLDPTNRIDGRSGAWSVQATEDTDGDGLAEIVWLDEHQRVLELQAPAHGISVMLGNLEKGWRGRGAADVDADGAGDLVMHHVDSGAVQSWALSSKGVDSASDLPAASGLGVHAGSGDFDGDGSEDLAWMDSATGAVTLMLDPAGAATVAVVDRPLPASGIVISGATGSDDSLFEERFCSGDFDGDGRVDKRDFNVFKQCYRKGASLEVCAEADMDSDGELSVADFEIFKMRFRGHGCGGF